MTVNRTYTYVCTYTVATYDVSYSYCSLSLGSLRDGAGGDDGRFYLN